MCICVSTYVIPFRIEFLLRFKSCHVCKARFSFPFSHSTLVCMCCDRMQHRTRKFLVLFVFVLVLTFSVLCSPVTAIDAMYNVNKVDWIIRMKPFIQIISTFNRDEIIIDGKIGNFFRSDTISSTDKANQK